MQRAWAMKESNYLDDGTYSASQIIVKTVKQLDPNEYSRYPDPFRTHVHVAGMGP